MATTILPLVIPAGNSISNPLEAGVLKAVRIGMPDAWDSAPLTIQISVDGAAWLDLHHAAPGSSGMWMPYETGVQQIVPNSILLLPPDSGLNLPWLKLRSGTRSKPVNQSSDRTFSIMFGE